LRTTFLVIGVVGLCSLGLVIACADSSSGESGNELPGRGTSSGDEGGTSSSGGSSGTSGSTADCTNHAPVSDTPACDTCAKAKCCDHIDKCDKNDDCKAAQDCIAACAEGDQFCGLTCLLSHEQGSEILQGLASCTSTKCKAECPSANPGDAGFDSPI
jgi:hypothetical protein